MTRDTHRQRGQAMTAIAQRNGVEFAGVTKRFRRQNTMMTALKDVDLEIAPGDFVCVVGPSGCGKSTLLNLLSGLMKPSDGDIRMGGAQIAMPNTRVGYITQKDTLMPWRTVTRNVSLPLEIAGHTGAAHDDRVQAMIETVGLEGFEKSYPSQLSGGMRKRVVLARTLVQDPEVLLADEPFGALDAQLRMILQEELQRIWMETGKTILFVTHDIAEAVTLADRVVVMSARPARVKLDRRIDLPRPRDVYRINARPEFTALVDELWQALGDDITLGEEN